MESNRALARHVTLKTAVILVLGVTVYFLSIKQTDRPLENVSSFVGTLGNVPRAKAVSAPMTEAGSADPFSIMVLKLSMPNRTVILSVVNNGTQDFFWWAGSWLAIMKSPISLLQGPMYEVFYSKLVFMAFVFSQMPLCHSLSFEFWLFPSRKEKVLYSLDWAFDAYGGLIWNWRRWVGRKLANFSLRWSTKWNSIFAIMFCSGGKGAFLCCSIDYCCLC